MSTLEQLIDHQAALQADVNQLRGEVIALAGLSLACGVLILLLAVTMRRHQP